MSAGIEKLKTSIRVWWRINGTRYRETLKDTPPTPANIEYAEGIADLIDRQIKKGVFDRDQMFPNSEKNKSSYFEYYIQLWLDTAESTVAPSSWSSYVSKVENHIKPYWGRKIIAKIKAEDVERWVYKTLMQSLSPKTIKDILGLFQTIWTYWARDQKNANDPTQYIKLGIRDSEDINPFTKQEITTILAMETQPILRNLWTVMIWSGLSTHELMPLAIEDLDLAQGCAYIKRGFVKGAYRVTKNRRRKRQIELLPIVTDALLDQISIIKENKMVRLKVLDRDNRTYRSEELTFLWPNPNTTSHYTYSQLEKRWKTHLSRCKVEYRSLNTGRHTYASQVLSTGVVTAEWLANQLGHANTNMIHKHYGKFIPEDSKHIISRLSQALSNEIFDA